MPHTSPHTTLLAVAAIAFFAAACGNPGPTGDEFVFTPVPYTVLPAEPGETPVVVALDADGSLYAEGTVSVLLPRDELEDFLEWLDEIGLEGKRQGEDLSDENATRAAERGVVIDEVLVVVRVPLGGATEARDLIRTRSGVEAADLNYLRSVH